MKRTFKKQSVSGSSNLTETCKTKSLTVPDQTLTIRELLMRSANGLYDDMMHDDYYNEDDDDYRGLDPSEMYYMAKQAGDVVVKDNDRKTKAKAKEEREKLKQEAIEEYKKSLEDAG